MPAAAVFGIGTLSRFAPAADTQYTWRWRDQAKAPTQAKGLGWTPRTSVRRSAPARWLPVATPSCRPTETARIRVRPDAQM